MLAGLLQPHRTLPQRRLCRRQGPLTISTPSTPTARLLASASNAARIAVDSAEFYAKRGACEVQTHQISVRTAKELAKGQLLERLLSFLAGAVSDEYIIATIYQPLGNVRVAQPAGGVGGPVIIMLSGFLQAAGCYQDFVTHLSRWGYYVIQANLRDLMSNFSNKCTDEALVGGLPGLIETLKKHRSLAQADWSLGVGVTGHSRGGKIAALLLGCSYLAATQPLDAAVFGNLSRTQISAIQQLDIKTGFFLDPVNSKDILCGRSEPPDAIRLWDSLQSKLAVGIIGAGAEWLIKPKNNMHRDFMRADDMQDSWNLIIQPALHDDFCKAPGSSFDQLSKLSDLLGGLSLPGFPGFRHIGGWQQLPIAGSAGIRFLYAQISSLVWARPLKTQGVIDLSKECMLAWFEKVFRSQAYHQAWYNAWQLKNAVHLKSLPKTP